MGEVIGRLRGSTGLERAGVGAFGLGALLDATYHLAPPPWGPGLAAYLGAGGERAHELTLVGMLLILARLIQIALARPRMETFEPEVRTDRESEEVDPASPRDAMESRTSGSSQPLPPQ
jgi:hypothetical protein